MYRKSRRKPPLAAEGGVTRHLSAGAAKSEKTAQAVSFGGGLSSMIRFVTDSGSGHIIWHRVGLSPKLIRRVHSDLPLSGSNLPAGVYSYATVQTDVSEPARVLRHHLKHPERLVFLLKSGSSVRKRGTQLERQGHIRTP
jgi:hypothetical protein